MKRVIVVGGGKFGSTIADFLENRVGRSYPPEAVRSTAA